MNNNKFSYLLNLLQISPSQMAEYLNVDRTLVSKWKNGTRSISVNSDYFNKALEFLVLRNKALNANLLENLFSSIYPELDTEVNHNSYLIKSLRNYILNDNTEHKTSQQQDNIAPNSVYNASVPIYNNEEKMLLGILNMLDSVIKSGKSETLIFIFNNTFDLLMNYDNFRSKWLEKVLTLLDMGCKLKLAYTISNSSKLFTCFSSLIFHKNCSILSYIDSFSYDNPKLSLHMIGNKIFFLSMYLSSERNLDAYGSIYLDPVSINFYTKAAEKIISKANPTLSKLDPRNVVNILRNKNHWQNNEAFANHNTFYYYNNIPSFYPIISDELFYEILCNSIDSEDIIKNEFDIFKEFKHNFRTYHGLNEKKHFYSINSLIEMANNENIVYREEFGQFPKLVASNSQFKRHMKELADYLLSNEKLNICLYSETPIPFTPSFHCWCKKNEYLIIFDNNHISESKICTDTAFINSVSNLFEQQFLYSPEHLKSKEFVADFLRNL